MNLMMNYNKTPILSIKDLTVIYNKFGSTVKALDKLTIESIQQGCWVFLIGSNGSGKSTLFKAIGNGIDNYSGKIELNGVDIKEYSSENLAKIVFLINQNPLASTVDELTVWENLIYATNGINKSDFDESLKQAGLEQHKDHVVKNLSGGQRQLLALQIARLRKVKLLMLDEPFAALDPVNVEKGLKLITDLQKTGTTIFFITHEMKLLKSHSSSSILIYKLHKGKIEI